MIKKVIMRVGWVIPLFGYLVGFLMVAQRVFVDSTWDCTPACRPGLMCAAVIVPCGEVIGRILMFSSLVLGAAWAVFVIIFFIRRYNERKILSSGNKDTQETK